MIHLWHSYWNYVGGNVSAMPLQSVVAVVATLLLQKPVRKGWRRLVGEKADIEDIRRMAAAAHKIAADLHEHVTGERHPHAPDKGEP
jgi:hypothetical protein